MSSRFVLSALLPVIVGTAITATPAYARDDSWYVVVPVESCSMVTTVNGYGQVLGSYPSCNTQLVCYLNDDVGERIKCPMGYKKRYKTQEKERVDAILAKLDADLTHLENQTNAELAKIDKQIQDNNNGEKQNYYPNGQLKNQYTLKDGKYQGLWTSWWENGQLQSTIPHVDGKAHGEAKEYAADGTLLNKTQYHWDSKSQTHTAKEFHYYPNGTLKKEQTRINDALQGVVKEYHSNGKLSTTATYVNNQKHGTEQQYDQTGKPTQSIRWVNGKRQ